MTKFEKRANHRLSAERLHVVMNAEKHSSLLNKVHRHSARKMTRTVQLQARVSLSDLIYFTFLLRFLSAHVLAQL